MKNRIHIIFILFLFISCNNKNKQKPIIDVDSIDDTKYIINKEYKKADVRRYGVLPNTPINPKHLKSILKLAEQGLEINFSEGLYKTDLLLQGRKNITLHFNNTEFSGQIKIIEGKNKVASSNIKLKGKITTYNKFFSRYAENIEIDTLIIATDTLKNSLGKRSLGCNIYVATKNVSIKKLLVKDLGSGDKYYKFTTAALQIHGWNNNPENIAIGEAVIEKSDRFGVYITGNNHKIKKLTVNNFGLGKMKYNNGIEDAANTEIYDLSAVWINKCNDCIFEKIIINTTKSKGKYSIKLDEGQAYNPTFINSLELIETGNPLPIFDDRLTNILVKRVKKH